MGKGDFFMPDTVRHLNITKSSLILKATMKGRVLFLLSLLKNWFRGVNQLVQKGLVATEWQSRDRNGIPHKARSSVSYSSDGYSLLWIPWSHGLQTERNLDVIAFDISSN